MASVKATISVRNEKDIFFSFSLDLLKVRTKKQLLHLLNERLKSLLGFVYSTIFLADTHGTVFFSEEPAENVKSDHQRLEFDLQEGKNVMGRWVLFYEEDEKPPQAYITILPSLATLIAVALLNILENEQMLERESENDIIQSLNIDFAAIRDKKDLLRIIHFKLKNLFDFSDHFVGVVNDDELTISSFLQDTRPWADEHLLYKKSVEAKYPISDRILNKVIISKEPQVFDLDQQFARGIMPEYFQILYDSGIKKVIMIGMQVRDRVIGLWCICQIEHQFLTDDQLRLIKGISSQLSIAVDNIRANEAILTREEEGRLLLQLSENIANIRDKNDLFKAINRNLKKLFQFEDIVIMLMNEDDTYYAFLFSLAQQSPGYTYYQKTSLKKYSFYDGCFRKAIEADGLIVLNLEQLYADPLAPDYIKFEFEHGIKEKVAIKLRDDQKSIGVFFVNSAEIGAYTDRELALIEGVSYQLSIAVSNILANEEIESRESERELLLSISNDIAAVRSNDELIRVITQKLKYQLAFSHVAIAIIDDDHLTCRAYILDPGSKSQGHPVYEELKNTKFPINDDILDKAYASSSPVVYDLDELSAQQNMPAYFSINHESGIRQAVITRFSKGKDVFGFWLIFFDKKSPLNKNKLSLLEGLANQLSIAVSNIIANEEIRARENEKSILLSFSNALASVRNRKELADAFTEQLKKFGIIRNYSLRRIMADRKHHQLFLYDTNADWTRHADFPKMLGMQADINDGVTNIVMNAGKPVTFNIRELNRRVTVPSYVKWWQEIGFDELKGMPVRLGDETIGILWLELSSDYDETAKYPLLKGICSQLAVAVSNILANEKVISQLDEINNYKRQLEEEKIYLKEELETTHNYSEIIGNSPEMQRTLHLVTQVAATDSTVLVLGETGTGKELIARAIHNNSLRKDRLMVKVNCAALPANLIESELFGHERGSFTGATERRVGKFELANNGTLFLDEIGEMPLELQVKLLRVLQEQEVERIGGKSTIKVNVRIITATNRDLEKEMADGRFRSDLYYRLNIFPISLPPLRSHLEDIPLLAAHFIQRFSKKSGKHIKKLSNSAYQQLLNYNWPGNIRELEHLIERSILLSEGDTIKHIELPSSKKGQSLKSSAEYNVLKTIDENERDHILNVLRYCNGRVAGEGGAAERLGVPKSTLNSKIKRLGIRREHIK